MKYFLVSEEDLNNLRDLRKLLHSENRMDGDTMRNWGHALEAFERNAIPYEEEL